MFDRFSYKNCPNLATLIWLLTIFVYLPTQTQQYYLDNTKKKEYLNMVNNQF